MTKYTRGNPSKKWFSLGITMVLFIGVGLPSVLTAGWQVVSPVVQWGEIKYSIRRDDGIASKQGFYFPEFAVLDSVLYDGYEVIRKQQIKILGLPSRRIPAWKKQFNPPIVITNETVLFRRLYVENVKAYTIYMRSALDSLWYKKEFKIFYEKYQVPLIDRLSDWEGIKGHDGQNTHGARLLADSDTNNIDEMTVVINPRNREYRFVIGDLAITDRHIIQENYYHPFFDLIIPEKPSNFVGGDSLLNNVEKSFTPFWPNSVQHYKYGFRQYLICDSDSIACGKKKILKALVEQILRLYPFYTERRIDQDKIFEEFYRISLNDSLDYPSLVDSVRVIFGSFHDPHLYMKGNFKTNSIKPKKRYIAGPVRLYEINNHIFIASVFEDSLAKVLTPGMKILKVDGKEIHSIVDSLSSQYRGDEKVRRNKAISRLLYRQRNEELNIEVIGANSDTVVAVIRCDSKIVVPSNFRPTHCGLICF